MVDRGCRARNAASSPWRPLAVYHRPEDARLEVGGAIFREAVEAYEKPDSPFPDLKPYATMSHYQASAVGRCRRAR